MAISFQLFPRVPALESLFDIRYFGVHLCLTISVKSFSGIRADGFGNQHQLHVEDRALNFERFRQCRCERLFLALDPVIAGAFNIPMPRGGANTASDRHPTGLIDRCAAARMLALLA